MNQFVKGVILIKCKNYISAKLVSRHSQLMTAGVGHSLKLWAVSGVSSMKLTSGGLSHSGSGLVMEDEMVLDGAVTSAEFDDTLDMVNSYLSLVVLLATSVLMDGRLSSVN